MPRRRPFLAAAAALIVSLAVLVAVLPAGHPTKADFASFKHCPLHNSRTDLCLLTQTVGGEFVLGSRTVPLNKTITLQGGIHVVKNNEREVVKDEFIAAVGGETLSKASQAVPGGLPAVVNPDLLRSASRNVFDGLLARGITQVMATIELATPASSIGVSTQNLIEARGIGLVLPLKVKLSNPFLGENCYIGSSAHPIVVALTTGTTLRSASHRPLAGKPGHANFTDHYNLITLSEDSLVSDSFAAPRAEGCGRSDSLAISRAVDAGLALPAAAGRNRAVLNATLRDANAPAVRASG